MTWRTFFTALYARIAPFLDLLDARYLPLLAVVAPQSYTVYAWLLRDGAPSWVAILGGLGYEAVYVGAVAWAEHGAGWSAARPPAVTALLFSVAVAVAYYAPTVGILAVLHAGFPVVAYAYTVMMHATPRTVTPLSTTPLSTPSVEYIDSVTIPDDSTPVLVDSGVTVDDSATTPPTVSKSARVKALALQDGVSETTIWRKVKKGEITL